MKTTNSITCLFLDIGGVLLSDGWDHNARKRAATKFNLEVSEMETRHHLIFDTYEEGKVTMDEYLDIVVSYKERSFTRPEFRSFLFAQTEPLSDIDIFRLALNAAHVPTEQAVYIDDLPLYVQVAEGLGIRGIHHTDYKSTLTQLTSFGLLHNERVVP